MNLLNTITRKQNIIKKKCDRDKGYRNNKTGVRGTCYDNGFILAQVQKNKKLVFHGRFKTLDEAKKALDDFKKISAEQGA